MHSFRSVAVVALMATVAVLAGCSKRDVVPEDPALTQTEADDLMQAISAEAATDSGGWLIEVTSTLKGTPLSVSSTGAVMRDTVVTVGNMTWNFSYTYFSTGGGSSGTWSPTAIRVEGITDGLGRIPLQVFAGATGSATPFHHNSDSFTLEGLAATDTMYIFSELAVVDSALFTINAPSGKRYYLLDNVVNYDVNLPKRLAGNPYAGTGEARINSFAAVLQNTNPASRTKILDAIMVITFDGTQTPLATITANSDPATTVFRYRVNLKTGAVTRAP
jgi:hypothetical protein